MAPSRSAVASIVAVGQTDEVLAEHLAGDDVADHRRAGPCVLPGLVECHSHPMFAGDRHHEYAERLGGASLAEVAARGGGIWSSVVATGMPATRSCPRGSRRLFGGSWPAG